MPENHLEVLLDHTGHILPDRVLYRAPENGSLKREFASVHVLLADSAVGNKNPEKQQREPVKLLASVVVIFVGSLVAGSLDLAFIFSEGVAVAVNEADLAALGIDHDILVADVAHEDLLILRVQKLPLGKGNAAADFHKLTPVPAAQIIVAAVDRINLVHHLLKVKREGQAAHQIAPEHAFFVIERLLGPANAVGFRRITKHLAELLLFVSGKPEDLGCLALSVRSADLTLAADVSVAVNLDFAAV